MGNQAPGPLSPDGRFYWDGQSWAPVPMLSPDGRFYWDGQSWVPVPMLSPDGRSMWDGYAWVPAPLGLTIAVGLSQGRAPRNSPQRRSEPLGWGGVAASIVALLLTVGLLSMRVLFVGVVDIALPLILAMAGIVLGYWGGTLQRVLSWIFGGLAVLTILVTVLGLAMEA